MMLTSLSFERNSQKRTRISFFFHPGTRADLLRVRSLMTQIATTQLQWLSRRCGRNIALIGIK